MSVRHFRTTNERTPFYALSNQTYPPEVRANCEPKSSRFFTRIFLCIYSLVTFGFFHFCAPFSRNCSVITLSISVHVCLILFFFLLLPLINFLTVSLFLDHLAQFPQICESRSAHIPSVPLTSEKYNLALPRKYITSSIARVQLSGTRFIKAGARNRAAKFPICNPTQWLWFSAAGR